MSKLSKKYNESKNYTDIIMDEIVSVLDKDKKEYTMKSKGNEIVVHTKDELEKFEKYLYGKVSVPTMIFKLLVEMVQVNDTVYIRRKVK